MYMQAFIHTVRTLALPNCFNCNNVRYIGNWESQMQPYTSVGLHVKIKSSFRHFSRLSVPPFLA